MSELLGLEIREIRVQILFGLNYSLSVLALHKATTATCLKQPIRELNAVKRA